MGALQIYIDDDDDDDKPTTNPRFLIGSIYAERYISGKQFCRM